MATGHEDSLNAKTLMKNHVRRCSLFYINFQQQFISTHQRRSFRMDNKNDGVMYIGYVNKSIKKWVLAKIISMMKYYGSVRNGGPIQAHLFWHLFVEKWWINIMRNKEFYHHSFSKRSNISYFDTTKFLNVIKAITYM